MKRSCLDTHSDPSKRVRRRKGHAGSSDRASPEVVSVQVPTVPVVPKAPRSITSESSHHFEFGGPIGSAVMIGGLPVGIFFLIWGARKPGLDSIYKEGLEALNNITSANPGFEMPSLFSVQATKICLGWFAFQVLLERLLPGTYVQGQPIPNDPTNGNKGGARLQYKVNGHLAFWASLVTLGLGHYTKTINLAVVHSIYVELAATAIVFSFVLACYLYVTSFIGSRHLAEGGTSGFKVYDFFMGRELNPRVCGSTFDLKYFCELRPGLIGWEALNISLAVHQYNNNGSVSVPMGMVVFLQGLYVWDALYYEQAILSTMDITTEGFGFMLAMGDLGWVPFTYSLQALYLADVDQKNENQMPNWYYLLVLLLGLWGYCAFRGSNGQKDDFRRNFKKHPERFEHLETLQTKRGTHLITSSWWGIARKINYTADLTMALSWSLLCGAVALPYFYPFYMTVLLVHRAYRDDAFCRHKYGVDWEEYKKRVPYMLIPGLF